MKNNYMSIIFIIFTMCSCERSKHASGPLDFSKQSSDESRIGYYKCCDYIEKANELTTVKYTTSHQGAFGQTHIDERTSIKHSYLGDDSIYIFHEDPSYDFVSDDFTDQEMLINGRTLTYSFYTENSSVCVSTKIFDLDSRSLKDVSYTYSVSGNNIIGSGDSFDIGLSAPLTILSGDSLDALIGSSGLVYYFAQQMVRHHTDATKFDRNISFDEIKDRCTEMCFKVENSEMVARVTSNILFEDTTEYSKFYQMYPDDYVSGEYIPGSGGYNESVDGSPQEGWEIGQVTQEFKFSNYLLTYYHWYYEFRGKIDSKVKFFKLNID